MALRTLKGGDAKSFRPSVYAWWVRVVESPLDALYHWYLYHGDMLMANGKNQYEDIEAECQAIIQAHKKGHTILILSE